MSNTVERSHRGALGTSIVSVAGAVLAVAFIAFLFASEPAQASSSLTGQAVPFVCSGAVPNAYSTFNTIANCGTTTTVPATAFTLTVSYDSGTVTWQACGSQSLAGTTAQLYIDGQAMTGSGGSATIGTNGCTGDQHLADCLATGSYNATAVDGPNQASKSFSVGNSGCANPQVLSGSNGLTGGGAGETRASSANNGLLPFTGSNIAVMLTAAALLAGLGLGIVRIARQKRNLV
jgi:hypothetical protein